jgi:uncharacterized protein YcfL
MKFPYICIPLALVALLAGCNSRNVNSFQRAQPEAQPNYVNDMRIITDSTLARSLRVNSINETRASGNLLQITATIENLKNNGRDFKYKFDWIDRNGTPAGDTGWRIVHLRGREINAITAIATNPNAADFRLKFEE